MEKVEVVYSLHWQIAPSTSKIEAFVESLSTNGMPVQILADGRIINVIRPSRNPKRSARVIVALLSDELNAVGIRPPTDYVVFTPHNDREIIRIDG